MKYIGISVLLGAIAGFCLSYFLFPNTEFQIKTETETKTEYIKIAATCQEYQDCYNSKMKISETIFNGNWMHIVAEDECKRGEKDIELAGTIFKKHIVQVGYSFFTAGGNIYSAPKVGYFYKFFPNVAFGGNFMANTWSPRQVLGVDVLAHFEF